MQCGECAKKFEYLPGEKEAYAKFDTPLPDNCPDCRQKRRMMFRNEKKLYYNNKLRNMMIAYEERDGGIDIVTIHPISEEKIINRLMSQRWTKNE